MTPRPAVSAPEGGYKVYRHWVLGPNSSKPGPLAAGWADARQTQDRPAAELERRASRGGSRGPGPITVACSFGGLGLRPSEHRTLSKIAWPPGGWPRGCRPIWLEAESVQVGRCRIPPALWRQMQAAPRLELRPTPRRARAGGSWRCTASQNGAAWPRHDPDRPAADRSGPVGPGRRLRRRTGPPPCPPDGWNITTVVTITKGAKSQVYGWRRWILMTLCERAEGRRAVASQKARSVGAA